MAASTAERMFGRIQGLTTSWLSRQRNEEKVHFAYQDHESTELANLGHIDSNTKDANLENGQPPAFNGGLHGHGPGALDGKEGATPVPTNYGEGSNESINRKPISAWDAAWNVTNAIQINNAVMADLLTAKNNNRFLKQLGMFLLALPYAVLNGGYWGLVALLSAAAITYYTGIILVDCLYENDPATGVKRRVRDSYVDIAAEVWGIYAAQIVHTAQFIELIMTCILYLVLCGDLLTNSMPAGKGTGTVLWTVVATFFVVPCAFLRDLKAVARLSLGNAFAHVIINVIVIGYCITHIGNWHWSEVKLKVDVKYFPVSMGIVIFSYTSHIFLPSLEGDMTNRRQFSTMLKWTHGLAGLFKALFAYVCFLTFGNATRDVITDNLPTASFKGFVNIALVVKALLSYPLPYFAAAELLERAFFSGRPRTKFPSCYASDGCLNVWAVFLRMLLVLFTLTLAIYIPHFALLMGLIGSFTGTMLSFVWPCWFHLKIKWYEIPHWQKLGDVCIMIGGGICGIIGIILSFDGLIESFREEA